MSEAIVPFTISISQSQLDDLALRLDLTRWPERETVEDWSQGVPLAQMRELADYWRHGYNWRACEARLNALPQFITTIDGLEFYFIHVRSPQPGAVPLIMTHGWPGSVLEYLDTIGPLTDPVAHGGTADQAFDVVIPALPGFGFSAKPDLHGWGTERIAEAWGELMSRLGYTRWFAQGGDWGSAVAQQIGARQVEGCAGIHINLVVCHPGEEDLEQPTEGTLRALEAMENHKRWEMGYSSQQSTRPQTIGYSLLDSPVGLAAWIFEKMWRWTDNRGSPYDALSRDQILDNIMLYWLTASGASAARLYWESFVSSHPMEISLPTAVTAFPREIIPTPREWARHFLNLVHWHDVDVGGHFGSWEQPALFVQELRESFALMR